MRPYTVLQGKHQHTAAHGTIDWWGCLFGRMERSMPAIFINKIGFGVERNIFFFFCLGQSVVLLVEVYTHKEHSVALFSLVQHSGILFYRGCQLQTTKLYLCMALTFTASRRRSSALYESPIIINNNNPMRVLVGAFDAAVHKSTHTHSDRHRRRHPKWPLVFNVHFSYPWSSNWTLLCNTVKRWRA